MSFVSPSTTRVSALVLAAAPPENAALQQQLQPHLPCDLAEARLVLDAHAPVSVSGGAGPLISAATLQHGASLPVLQVQALHEHALLDKGDAKAQELDKIVKWLFESLNESRCPMLGAGVAANHRVMGLSFLPNAADGSPRALALSSASRCVILHLPPEEVAAAWWKQQQHVGEPGGEGAPGGPAANGASAVPALSSSPPKLFSPFLRSLLESKDVLKAALNAPSKLLTLWRCAGVGAASCIDMAALVAPPSSGASSAPAVSAQELMKVCFGPGSANLPLPPSVSQYQNGAGAHAPIPRSLGLEEFVALALEAQVSCVAATRLTALPPLLGLAELPISMRNALAEWARMLENPLLLRGGANGADGAQVLALARRQVPRALSRQGDWFHPFVHALLGLPFPAEEEVLQQFASLSNSNAAPGGASAQATLLRVAGDERVVDVSPSAAKWWFRSTLERNFDQSYSEVPLAAKVLKDRSQAEALEETDGGRITLVEGQPGTGRTTLAAVAALAALTRCSSIEMDVTNPVFHRAPQKVLCVAGGEYAARRLADTLATLLPPEMLAFVCTRPFLNEWREGECSNLRAHGYVCALDDASHVHSVLSQAMVVVLGTEAALAATAAHPALGCFVQTLVVDNAQGVWMMHLLLLLRRMPHLERMLLFGDPRQMLPTLGATELAEKNTLWHQVRARVGQVQFLPVPFRPRVASLTRQHRLPAQLHRAVSQLFYSAGADGPSTPLPPLSKLPPDPNGAHASTRSLMWVDMPFDGAQRADGSWPASTKALDALVELWNYWAKQPNFTMEDIAIVALCDIHRAALMQAHGAVLGPRVLRAEEVDNAQVQVLLLLVGVPSPHRPELFDARRLGVILSRASKNVFVVANRAALLGALPAGSIWHRLSEIEQAPAQVQAQGRASVSPANVGAHRPASVASAAASSVEGEEDEENSEGEGQSAAASSEEEEEDEEEEEEEEKAPAPAPVAKKPPPYLLPAALKLKLTPMPKRHKDVLHFERIKTIPCTIGACSKGAMECGQLHPTEFWLRPTMLSAHASEWWLCTVGSKIVRTEKSGMLADERRRLLIIALDSQRNKALQQKHQHEFIGGPLPEVAAPVAAAAASAGPSAAHARAASVDSSSSSPALGPSATAGERVGFTLSFSSVRQVAGGFELGVLGRAEVYKVEECRHALSSRCQGGSRCGFLHDPEFWVRISPTEVWLLTPGSKSVVADQVMGERAWRNALYDKLIVSARNKRARARHGKEFALLFGGDVQRACGVGDPFVAALEGGSSSSSPALGARAASPFFKQDAGSAPPSLQLGATAARPVVPAPTVPVPVPVPSARAAPIPVPVPAPAPAPVPAPVPVPVPSPAAPAPAPAAAAAASVPVLPPRVDSSGDEKLISELYDAIRTKPGLTLSQLGKQYAACTLRQWNSVAPQPGLSIGDFVRQRPERFDLLPNPDEKKAHDPVVAKAKPVAGGLGKAAALSVVVKPVHSDNPLWKMRRCSMRDCWRAQTGSCEYLHASEFWLELPDGRFWLLTEKSNVVYEEAAPGQQKAKYIRNAIDAEDNREARDRALPALAGLLPPAQRDQIMREAGFEVKSTAAAPAHAQAQAQAKPPAAAAPSALVRPAPVDRRWKFRLCADPSCVRGSACSFLHPAEHWVCLDGARWWLMSTESPIVYEAADVDENKAALLRQDYTRDAPDGWERRVRAMPKLAHLLPQEHRARIMSEHGYRQRAPATAGQAPAPQQAAAAAAKPAAAASAAAAASDKKDSAAASAAAAEDESWLLVEAGSRHAARHNDKLAKEIEEGPAPVNAPTTFDVLALSKK